MLLTRATLEAIAAGTVTLAFRRWRRPTVRTGGTLTGIVKLTKSSSIDPQDTGLQPVANPPCWASRTALTPLYVKTAAQEASLSCWRVRKSLMTR